MALDMPMIAIDHIAAHLYSSHMTAAIAYPYLGLLLSGGHTLITHVEDFDRFTVLGSTVDDACGEAFDKVAKHYDFGFPGGVAIERLAESGDNRSFALPKPSLHKGDHRYDVSYSGLKTAVVHQLEQFWNREYPKTRENIAASFQATAIEIILEKVLIASEDLQLPRIVVAGGVAANGYLRRRLREQTTVEVIFPDIRLCTDNGAMIAGLGFHHLRRGDRSKYSVPAEARLPHVRQASGKRVPRPR